MHKEGPVVPETTPSPHVTKDEIFENVTIEVADNVCAGHTDQTTEVAFELHLALGYLFTERDAIVYHV